MGFWESVGFWFAKALTEFLLGVGLVAVFILIMLVVEYRNAKRKAEYEQRKAAEAVSSKGKKCF